MLKFRIWDKERSEYLDDRHYPRQGGWGHTQAVTTDGAMLEYWFTGGMSESVPQIRLLPSTRYEPRIQS